MRVFLIVLDSFGIGALPDAAKYLDEGSNTLRSIASSPCFKADTMRDLGLFNIAGVNFLPSTDNPVGIYGRMKEASEGKDTTIGHWEIAGVISDKPLPTYPEGFPQEIIDEFVKRTGRGVLCNQPYSGTEVIKDYGEKHVKTGKLIVYTSADSVFQIAAHEDVVPLEKLYEYCEVVREILTGNHGVGRVIARPFNGIYPAFKRTSNRRDYSIKPPRKTLLNALYAAGKDVIAVGKIYDIFAGSGITKVIKTKNNADGMKATMDLLKEDFDGLVFTNLVDFDMLYGHRNDVDGYAKAVAEFDDWLYRFLLNIRDDDIVIITGDHGCDPGTPSTDHSREYTPLLFYKPNIVPRNLNTRNSFADIGKTVAKLFGISEQLDGESLI